MRIQLLLVLSLFGVVFSGSSLANQLRIIGGQEASPNAYPWLVSLGYLDENAHYHHGCGGTILDQDFILTAAHCVFSVTHVQLNNGNLKSSDATVVKLDGEAVPYIHPDYNNVTMQNDLALYYLPDLAGSLSSGKIHLSEDDSVITTETLFTVAGWGLTMRPESISENTPESDYLTDWLMEVELPYVSDSTCSDKLGTADDLAGYDPETMICAGATGTDSCFGDSGGPLFIHNTNDASIALYGIVSWGLGCGSEGTPGAYTRISTYRDWIQTTQELARAGIRLSVPNRLLPAMPNETRRFSVYIENVSDHDIVLTGIGASDSHLTNLEHTCDSTLTYSDGCKITIDISTAESKSLTTNLNFEIDGQAFTVPVFTEIALPFEPNLTPAFIDIPELFVSGTHPEVTSWSGDTGLVFGDSSNNVMKHNEHSLVHFEVEGPKDVIFQQAVSSEFRGDYYRAYVDGTPVNGQALSGIHPEWRYVGFRVPVGSHHITIGYVKNSRLALHSDSMAIRNLEIRNTDSGIPSLLDGEKFRVFTFDDGRYVEELHDYTITAVNSNRPKGGASLGFMLTLAAFFLAGLRRPVER